MDGNNSAKRVASAGLVDSAEFESDYLLPREDVDRFKDEVPGRKRKSTPAHEHNRSVSSIDIILDIDATLKPDTFDRLILTPILRMRAYMTHHGFLTPQHQAT